MAHRNWGNQRHSLVSKWIRDSSMMTWADDLSPPLDVLGSTHTISAKVDQENGEAQPGNRSKHGQPRPWGGLARRHVIRAKVSAGQVTIMGSRPEDTEDGQAEVHGRKLCSRGARAGGGEPE